METTIVEELPWALLAQPINPVIAKNNSFILCVGKTRTTTCSKKIECMHVPLKILANLPSANAVKKVTMLYQPFTSPVQPTACHKQQDYF
jgi:hypothetical protein